MRITHKTKYPNLAKQFKNRDEIGKVIYKSGKTVQRSMSGNRPFDEYEIKRIEEYTGLDREFLLRRVGV